MPADSNALSNHVLIISHEQVGVQMAGPGIRCWELARALAGEFQVSLAVPGHPRLEGEGFALLAYDSDDKPSLERLEEIAGNQTDTVVASGQLLHTMPFLRHLDVPLVADVYIPVAVESLAWNSSSEASEQEQAYRYSWQVTRAVARHADLLICASERQRDFWLGALAAHGRLHPRVYAGDPDLRALIDVVPFGCQAQPPHPGPALKGIWPGIGRQDRVILWGGGVWNWFDPITLLQAMPLVLEQHPKAKLVFMGANHPDSDRVPEMERAREAKALSQELGLEQKAVFWGDWIPYRERGAYLMDADVGVSLHRDSIEVRLAFRTRLLDAIWAGLPMVLTRGDELGEEFERLDLGYAVDAGNLEQVARAINILLDEGEPRSSRQPAFGLLREKYDWQQVTHPLKQFCSAPAEDVGKRNALDLSEQRAKDQVRALQAEVVRLQEMVNGYESGRAMRALAALQSLRERLGG